jgi:hypothetical protein
MIDIVRLRFANQQLSAQLEKCAEKIKHQEEVIKNLTNHIAAMKTRAIKKRKV